MSKHAWPLSVAILVVTVSDPISAAALAVVMLVGAALAAWRPAHPTRWVALAWVGEGLVPGLGAAAVAAAGALAKTPHTVLAAALVGAAAVAFLAPWRLGAGSLLILAALLTALARRA